MRAHLKRLVCRCIAIGFFCGFAVAAQPILGLSAPLLEFTGQRYGAEAKQRIVLWQNLMVRYSGEPELTQLGIVNEFFNQIPYIPDQANWGKPDYWATPVELLSVNGGDCEDFAIAKYLSLTAMGFPPESLRITYVTAIVFTTAQFAIIPHMVLAYFPPANADPLILDNLTSEIKAASQRRDLAPIYSFNIESFWFAKEYWHGQLSGKSDRISLWNDFLVRLKREAETAEQMVKTSAAITASIETAVIRQTSR